MLKTRIIPCLDIADGRVVKGVNFVDLIDAGDPVEQALTYQQQGADELCFLDITATHENRDTTYKVVEQVAGQCFMPLTVGGGVKTLDDIHILLKSGADKVSINSAAIKNPEFVKQAADKFGSQCIVVAIDAKYNGNNYEIFTHGGRNSTGIDAIGWAAKMHNYGAGEILLTSMDADGTKQGFDNRLNKLVTDKVNLPLIASGGVGQLQHFADGYNIGGCTGLLAASVFHFGQFTIGQVKEYMASQGIAVRI